jgi:retron-type reverse transcriptase
MKTYNKLYEKLCSTENLILAFNKAKKGKRKKNYVINFELNLKKNLRCLQEDLINKTYNPCSLKKFTIRDPKTRTIHSSIFRDRIVHHAIINLLNPIYEKIFIYDSFASRKNKGTHNAIIRFKSFVRKVSNNGSLIKNSYSNNSIKGYVLKADIRHYFYSIDHEVLISILRKKIKDEDFIWLIRKVLENFEIEKGKGLPLGNYTSQFFANVYLNELDYFIKNILKAKYYIRYVDDFVILHKRKKWLEYALKRINNYLPCLKIELHKDKTKILPLRNGITFLGYRIFYHYTLLRKRNVKSFLRKLESNKKLLENNEITKEQFDSRLNGWLGYAKFADTFNFRNKILSSIKKD